MGRVYCPLPLKSVWLFINFPVDSNLQRYTNLLPPRTHTHAHTYTQPQPLSVSLTLSLSSSLPHTHTWVCNCNETAENFRMCWWVNKYLNTHTNCHTHSLTHTLAKERHTLNALLYVCIFIFTAISVHHLQCCKTLRPKMARPQKGCCHCHCHCRLQVSCPFECGTFPLPHMGVARDKRGRGGVLGQKRVGKLVLWPNEFYTSQILILAWFVIRCGHSAPRRPRWTLSRRQMERRKKCCSRAPRAIDKYANGGENA